MTRRVERAARLLMSATITTSQSGWSRLFWEAFRRSKNAMTLLDDRRHLVEVNGCFLQLVGYRHSDLIGRPIYEFVAPEVALSTRQWQALLHQPQFSGETLLVCSDGRQVAVEFAGHPEIVTGRQLVLVVAMHVGRRRPRPVLHTQTDRKREPLSKREREVVELIAMGLSGPEIAEELHLSHNTVRTHARNAMRKVDARSRAQLVAKAVGEELYSRDAA